MDNDLDIFRKRQERKKKKKAKPEPQAVFLAKGENKEAEVFLTDGERAEFISTPKEQSMLMNWQKAHTE